MVKMTKPRFLSPRKCPLCKQSSLFLTANDFCMCILEFEPVNVKVLSKRRLVRMFKSDPSQDAYYLAKFMALTSKRNYKGSIEFKNSDIPLSERKKFYASWEWKKVRYNFLKNSERKCLLCGSTDSLVVDHVKPIKNHWEERLNINNLQVLCNDCNMGKCDSADDFR